MAKNMESIISGLRGSQNRGTFLRGSCDKYLGGLYPRPLPIWPQGIIPCQRTQAAMAKSLSAVSWLATDLFDLRFPFSRNRLRGKLVIVGGGGFILGPKL